MSFVCLPSFVFTTQIKFDECCVEFKCVTQWLCSSFSNVVVCWCEVKRKRVNCWWMPFVSSFFSLHHSDRVQWVLCLIVMLHSVMLLPYFQSCFLLMWSEKEKSDLFMDAFFVCLSFFCLYHSDWVLWVLCLISMIHSVALLLLFQCCSLLLKIRKE